MTYTIDTALAISFMIGTALQVSMLVATISLKRYSNKAIDKARLMSEEAEGIAAEAEKIHEGSMMCLKMANEMFFCKTSDERANVVIKWVPKLQEYGVDLKDIDEIINS